MLNLQYSSTEINHFQHDTVTNSFESSCACLTFLCLFLPLLHPGCDRIKLSSASNFAFSISFFRSSGGIVVKLLV